MLALIDACFDFLKYCSRFELNLIEIWRPLSASVGVFNVYEMTENKIFLIHCMIFPALK